MTTDHPIERYLLRHPAIATLAYAVLVAVLFLTATFGITNIGERQRAVDASAELLARLEGRSPFGSAEPGSASGHIPTGSPFLEGQTVTVAGAALLQRVATAVTRAGGNVLSSQVELQGTQSKDGYVNLIASCELDQPALQSLLYDLEAGMPFLFLDQLVAQAPIASMEGGRMRVLIGVSGLWPGAK
jgi:general secretion pathway protein M